MDPQIAELATFKRYEQRYGQSHNTVGEDEARDNFFKDQQIEDQYQQQMKRVRKPLQKEVKQSMTVQVTSNYKDLGPPKSSNAAMTSLDEINDSDLDMLLDDLNDVLNEEDIEDSD